MNRPKYELIYGQRSGKNLMFLNYVENLERYCDELEKALDKACEKLRDYDEIDQLQYGLRRPKDPEEWKWWCLEEDE